MAVAYVTIQFPEPSETFATNEVRVRAESGVTRDLVLSLMLLPRAFDILSEFERRPPDVVHMYWGHFPTLVGFLVQRVFRAS